MIYPEGTRFTSKKHEISQKFAAEKGLPLLKHHLTPRTKGFTTSLQAMKGKFPAVYDVQLAFSKNEKVICRKIIIRTVNLKLNLLI